MFVSTYSTYITSNSSNKNTTSKGEDSTAKNFSLAQISDSDTEIKVYTKNLGINYISNYKALSNRQKLQDQTQDQKMTEVQKTSVVKNAKKAYKENSAFLSFLQKPLRTFHRVPLEKKESTTKIEQTKEKQLRQAMLDTYKANDMYYRLTSAA